MVAPASVVPSRRIAVVSVARSDYGIYRPLLHAIADDPALELALVVAASHLTRQFGDTLGEILADGFEPAARVECAPASDSPGSVARAMGMATQGFASALEALRPDLLVVLGDRYDMHAAACAAVPLLIPLVHIAGGAVTRGAIDDAFRHSMTKFAHLHFCETAEQGARIGRMGEAAWRIHVTGSLAIDNLREVALYDLPAFNARFGTGLEAPPVLITVHPVTREPEGAAGRIDALLRALDGVPGPLLFTYPNADPAGRLIIDRIDAFAGARPGRAFVVPHLGTRGYFSAMALARCMVGNSSSGVMEAASFGLPVVDIGRRQEGRLAPDNVVRCGDRREEVEAALTRALSDGFRAAARQVVNPYGDGQAAPRMVRVLKSVALDRSLLVKENF